MSDNINLSTLNNDQLKTFNFSEHQNLISQQQFNELMKKEGEITLDSEGNFKVINPPASRDNFFVSFIKRIFVRGYAEKERQLDRMESLKQNAQFNALVRDHVKNYATSQIGSTPIVTTAQNISNSIDAHFAQNNGFEKEKLKNLIQTAKNADETVKEYANTILNDRCGPNAIRLNGESLSLSGFMKKFANGKEFSETKIIEAIIQKAGSNPEQLEGLAKKDYAQKVKNLLAEPSLKEFDRNLLSQLTGNITHSVISKINDYIQKQLGSGFSPESIAGKVLNAVNSLINDDKGSNSTVLGDLFRDGGTLDAKNSADLVKTNAPQGPNLNENSDKVLKANYEKLVLAFPDVPIENIPKIIAFNDNDPQKIDNYIQLVTTFNKKKTIDSSFTQLLHYAQRGDFSTVQQYGEDIAKFLKEMGGNQNLTQEQLNGNMKVLINYAMLMVPENDEHKLTRINFSQITQIMIPVLENILEETNEIQDADGLNAIEEGRQNEIIYQKEGLMAALSALKEAKSQIMGSRYGSTVSDISEKDQKRMQEDYKNALNVTMQLKRSDYPHEIDNAVTIFPESVRKGVSVLLKDLVSDYVAKNGLKDSRGNAPLSLQSIANNLAKVIKNDKYLMSIINLTIPNEQFFAPHEDTFTNAPSFGMKETYLDEKQRRINDGWHSSLDRDVGRKFITRINETNIAEIDSSEGMINKTRELLGNIDKDFLGYVTTYLMQGGQAKYIAFAMQDKKNSLIPNVTIMDAKEKGVGISFKNEHQVDIKDNQIIITSHSIPQIFLNENYRDQNFNTQKASFYGFKFVTTIDTSKGVDENGYPLGIETKISLDKNI